MVRMIEELRLRDDCPAGILSGSEGINDEWLNRQRGLVRKGHAIAKAVAETAASDGGQNSY